LDHLQGLAAAVGGPFFRAAGLGHPCFQPSCTSEGSRGDLDLSEPSGSEEIGRAVGGNGKLLEQTAAASPNGHAGTRPVQHAAPCAGLGLGPPLRPHYLPDVSGTPQKCSTD